MHQKKFGLATAVAMIVGIVVGSGIFFKSDNILFYTGGNIFLGVLVFCLSAMAIIFGSLSLSEMASRTDKPGGIIAYAEEFCSSRMACAFGWFQTFIYYPTLTAVITWVSGIYIFMLFGRESTLLEEVLAGSVFLVLFYLLNIFCANLGGHLQNICTVIKLLPLILMAIAGLVFGDPQTFTHSVSAEALSSSGWLAAVGPIAFAFDGWIVATSIGAEIRDSKKNLPIAMVAAPLGILLAYILYFVGISILVGPENVVALGDAHVDQAAQMILGPMGAKIFLVFVTVSVLGTQNGLIIGFIRAPYALALRGMFPDSKRVAEVDMRFYVPVRSAVISAILVVIWLVIHFLTQYFGLLPNSDVSEIAIVVSYLCYTVLYFKVMDMARKGIVKSPIKGYLNPILATIGSLFILAGGLANPLLPVYLGICALVILASQIYYKRSTAQAK